MLINIACSVTLISNLINGQSYLINARSLTDGINTHIYFSVNVTRNALIFFFLSVHTVKMLLKVE